MSISYSMHRHILWHEHTGLHIIIFSNKAEIDFIEVIDILIARLLINA